MLLTQKISNTRSFEWLSQMRFYFDPKKTDVLQQLSIHMANAQFNYGFEYLGVQDKLVQTPLTDRCYLTMTQALEERLGGSPFGELTSTVDLWHFYFRCPSWWLYYFCLIFTGSLFDSLQFIKCYFFYFVPQRTKSDNKMK